MRAARDAALCLVAARQAALLRAGEAWLAGQFADLAVSAHDDALRLTGPRLVARALGSRRAAPEARLVTLADDLKRVMDEEPLP